jgi:hypothetical protein
MFYRKRRFVNIVRIIEAIINQRNFPWNRSGERGGLKIRKIMSVKIAISGKLIEIIIFMCKSFYLRIDLSRVNEAACKIDAARGNKKTHF